jgi:hypothetical protein
MQWVGLVKHKRFYIWPTQPLIPHNHKTIWFFSSSNFIKYDNIIRYFIVISRDKSRIALVTKDLYINHFIIYN